jgi:16S rRNA (cytosine1402-N4)-methyltransferase
VESPAPHIPVLLRETVERLVPAGGAEPGAWYIDGTAGAGGHSAAILDAAGPGARLLALDRDADAVELARARLAPYGERATVVRAEFSEMGDVARGLGIGAAAGILLDLGVSSMQLDRPERGFGFMHDGPLDMRMDDRQVETAETLLARLDEAELARILREYGEEPAARRIACAIAEARAEGHLPTTTSELAELVSRAKGGRRGRIHPATQTFQALRIAVNGELDALDRALPAALDLLAPGGRLAVISFHSLEDRRAKHFMAAHEGRMESLPMGGARWCGQLPRGRRIDRRAVVAGEEEAARNPRARSAKLRVIERTE